jgi:hypothetical protein
MTGMSQITQAADPYPWRWKKGTTGNPGGRRREEATIRELAQSYCPAAIHALAKLAGLATDANGKPIPGARADTSRIAAMRELLDRGIGRPRQDLAVEGDSSSLILLHLTAAQTVSQEILERQAQPVTIDAQPQEVPGNLLDAPLPTE